MLQVLDLDKPHHLKDRATGIQLCSGKVDVGVFTDSFEDPEIMDLILRGRTGIGKTCCPECQQRYDAQKR